MARTRTSMKKIREVIRLKSTTALSDRQIARALNISRPVVAKYWRGFSESDLSVDSIEDIPDSTLIKAIEKPRVETSGKYRELCQYFPYFVTELKRPGVTFTFCGRNTNGSIPADFNIRNSATTSRCGGTAVK